MHIALTADVYAAVHHIRQKYPQAPVFVIGFSIGAYTLTKYVGEADSGVWPEGQLQKDLVIRTVFIPKVFVLTSELHYFE